MRQATKRSFSASNVGGLRSTVTCAIESLKDEMNPLGSYNRLRSDMAAALIYRMGGGSIMG